MILGHKVAFRAPEEGDLELLQTMINDPQISSLVGGFSFPVSLAAQREWFKRSLGHSHTQRFIVVDRESGDAIGMTGLWNIDWQARSALTALKIADTATRGKGLGTDAIRTLVAYAFDQIGLHRLWSEIVVYNAASKRAYVEKAGFRVEGTNRESMYRNGQFHDQLRIALLQNEYAEDKSYDEWRATLREPRV